mmetsp:Transcript_7577/g.16949  ORF Transcript_7577/g.16949 Transcript_7577/m.16949 type:complete len:357 (-) Transcript_7577:302-1372(-)
MHFSSCARLARKASTMAARRLCLRIASSSLTAASPPAPTRGCDTPNCIASTSLRNCCSLACVCGVGETPPPAPRPKSPLCSASGATLSSHPTTSTDPPTELSVSLSCVYLRSVDCTGASSPCPSPPPSIPTKSTSSLRNMRSASLSRLLRATLRAACVNSSAKCAEELGEAGGAVRPSGCWGPRPPSDWRRAVVLVGVGLLLPDGLMLLALDGCTTLDLLAIVFHFQSQAVSMPPMASLSRCVGVLARPCSLPALRAPRCELGDCARPSSEEAYCAPGAQLASKDPVDRRPVLESCAREIGRNSLFGEGVRSRSSLFEVCVVWSGLLWRRDLSLRVTSGPFFVVMMCARLSDTDNP